MNKKRGKYSEIFNTAGVILSVTLLVAGLIYAINDVMSLPEVHMSTSGQVTAVYDQHGLLVTNPVVRAKLIAGKWAGGGPVYEP